MAAMGRWPWLAMAMAVSASSTRAAQPLLLVELPPEVGPGAEARLRERLGDRVVDATRTRALLDEASALGLRCPRLDEQCAAGFGQLAGRQRRHPGPAAATGRRAPIVVVSP